MQYSGLRRLYFRATKLLGLTDYYWRKNLKEHGAFARRDDRPYQP